MAMAAHVHVSAGRVIAAAVVTLLAAGIELLVSRTAASLFLSADALHLLAHLGIFVILLLPAAAAHDAREDVATCAVLLVVIAVAVWIGRDSWSGLLDARPPPSPRALLISLCGLTANLVTAWLLRGAAQRRWSFRAALAHELADASLTVAGLIGAGVIALFHVGWIDPALGLGVSLWLLGWAGRLIVRRVREGRSAWEGLSGFQ